MGSLSMVEAKLPPGFRFHPRDDELICDYLMKKIAGGAAVSGGDDHHQLPILIQVDLNKCEPWDIPEVACVGMNGKKEFYFYCQRDRKYATGLRTNRATISGYWKATGKDREVMKKNSCFLVGMRKTLVFYQGRAPKGNKTDWVMHEFRLATNSYPTKDDDWVLCRVSHKKKEDSSSINKQAMGSLFTHYSQDNDDDTSSPLPLLLEQYFTFDQSQLPNLHQYQSSPSISQVTHDQPQNNLLSSTNNIIDNHNFYIPNTHSSQKYSSDFCFTEQYFNH